MLIEENLQIPLYYAIIDNKKVYDEDSIRENFESKLKEVLEED